MGKSAPRPPDPDPNIGRAALMQAQTGQEWLDFSREAFAVSNERLAEIDNLTREVTQQQIGLARDQFDLTRRTTDAGMDIARDQQDLARTVTEQQLGIQDEQLDWARQDRQRYLDTFRGREDRYLDAIDAYDPNARQAERDALNERLVNQQLGIGDRFERQADTDRARYESQYVPQEERYLAAVDRYDPGARQAERDALNNRLIEQQLGIAGRSTEAATADRARYERDFAPIEERIAKDAMEYDSPDRQRAAAAEAKSDVMAAADAQRQQSQREAASMGVNPNSGRFVAVNRANDLQTTLASAGAQNAARQDVRDRAMDLRAQAAGLGRGLTTQSMQQNQIGLGAGAQAGATGAAAEAERRSGELSAIEARANATNMGRGLAAQSGQQRQASLGAGAQAGATAAAAESERQAADLRRVALQADAANFGRGMPAQAATSASLGLQAGASAAGIGQGAAGLGINAGNAAISNMGSASAGLGGAYAGGLGAAQTNLGLYNASTGMMNAGFGGQMQGFAGQANTLQNQWNTQVDIWRTQQASAAQNAAGIGSAIGGILGLFASDEDAKMDKEPLGEGEALEALDNMPIEEWTYKPGIGDGGRHIGPYAQDFQRETGKGDGRTIAAQDAIGITMAAVKDLDRKIDKIAGAIGLGDADAPATGRPSRPEPVGLVIGPAPAKRGKQNAMKEAA